MIQATTSCSISSRVPYYYRWRVTQQPWHAITIFPPRTISRSRLVLLSNWVTSDQVSPLRSSQPFRSTRTRHSFSLTLTQQVYIPLLVKSSFICSPHAEMAHTKTFVTELNGCSPRPSEMACCCLKACCLAGR